MLTFGHIRLNFRFPSNLSQILKRLKKWVNSDTTKYRVGSFIQKDEIQEITDLGITGNLQKKEQNLTRAKKANNFAYSGKLYSGYTSKYHKEYILKMYIGGTHLLRYHKKYKLNPSICLGVMTRKKVLLVPQFPILTFYNFHCEMR